MPETRFQGFDLMSLAPEATPSSGSSNPAAAGASFFGEPTNANAFQIDGVTVTDPGGGGQFPFYSPDFFDIVELTSIGGSAEFGKAMGSVFNVVTKSGGNSYHGEGNLFLQNNAFITDNTAGVNAEFDEDFTPPLLDHRADFSFGIGGPVKRDRIWFFTSYQFFNENDTRAGVSFPHTEDSDRFLGKITWQLNADNRLITGVMSDTYTVGGRPNSTDWSFAGTVFEPSMSFTPQVTWNSVLSPDTFLEVKYSGFYGYFDLIPISQNTHFNWDLDTGLFTGAYWGHYTFDRSRSDFQGSLSHFADDWAGSHSFKFGVEFERNSTDDHNVYSTKDGLSIQYVSYFGAPYLAYAQDPDASRNTSLITATTFFAQDDWTVADRLTFNLGIRLDHWNIGFRDASRNDEPSFNDVAPRVGVNLDLRGDGRTSVNAFWGRFFEEPGGSDFDNYDPQRSDGVGLFWDGAAYQEFFRVNPIQDIGIDPTLTNAYSDQVVVGVDHQLTEDLAITVRYIRKRARNLWGAMDTGSTFVPVTVTDVNGNTITVYNAAPLDRFRLLTNNPWSSIWGDAFRDYNGFQIKGTKRLSNNWSLIASLLIQKAEGNFGSSSGSQSGFDDPNDFVPGAGELNNGRRYVSKFQGSWLLPDPIRTLIGFQANILAGGRTHKVQRFSRFPDSSGTRFGQRSVTVPIEERGSRSLDSMQSLDLRFEKKFQLPGGWGDIGAIFDVFNVFNDDTIVRIRTRVPTFEFGDPRRIATPRIYRLGVRWLF